MRRKMLLVHAVSDQARYFNPESSQAIMAPLWPAVIAALTPEDQWDVEAIDEGLKPCRFEGADLVGIGALSMNVARAYELAEGYRRRGIPVVMGGWHVSVLPDEALQYCDAVVAGEAEPVWDQVLDDFKAGKLQGVYRAESPPDLVRSRIPPARRGVLRKRYYCASIQFSRGCLGQCDFCTIGKVYGPGVRYRPIEDVLDEIQSCREKHIWFVDENLTGWNHNQQDRLIELLQEWDRRGIRRKWSAQGSVNLVDNDELLHWMRRTGCMYMFVGFEDIHETHLKSMKKAQNARSDYRRVIEKLHDHDIGVFGSFIVGLPGQTAEQVRELIDFCVESGVDHALMAQAALVPGCKWWERFKDAAPYRNLPADYVNLCGSFLPVLPDSPITLDQWKELYLDMARRLFSPAQIRRRWWRWAKKGCWDHAFMTMGLNKAGRQYLQQVAHVEKAVDPASGRWLLGNGGRR